ncbi:shikimate dehydrogenase [Propionibacteriaceae bacterium G1746]
MLSQFGAERVCGVIGHPAHHSLSPAMHRAAYAAAGLDWSYDWHDVMPEALPAFVGGLDEHWRGLSVTMPHKQAITALGEPDEVVRLVGVANTLLRNAGATNTVHNTDVPGFVTACASVGLDQLDHLAVVGNGGTARAAIVAGARMGAQRVTVLARRPERAQPLAELADVLGVAFTVVPLDEGLSHAVDVVFSTVPTEGIAPYAEALVARAGLAFDAVYDPWPTPLGQAAERAGVPALSGLHLLAGQAVDQVSMMTGIDATEVGAGFAVLYEAGVAELRRRQHA